MNCIAYRPFAYSIYLIKENIIVGYLNVSTPFANQKLDSWTVDYWLGKIVRGQGVMNSCLSHLLGYIQKHGVREVKHEFTKIIQIQ